MFVLVNGNVEELVCLSKSGTDLAAKMVSLYDVLHTDEKTGMVVMSPDQYKWWILEIKKKKLFSEMNRQLKILTNYELAYNEICETQKVLEGL